MIYPKNFEIKIGFNEIRIALKGRCLSSLGSEMVDNISFLDNAEIINEQMEQVREFRRIMEDEESYPDENFLDLRSSLVRIQLKGSYLDESEFFALKTSLITISQIISFLNPEKDKEEDDEDPSEVKYPALQKLTKDISVFPSIIDQIDAILNKFGKIKDNASPELQKIRLSIASTKKSITSSLRTILHKAQENGYAPTDAAPTLRDGRLVIPTFPALKRKVNGIIHDESATGKTVFIEPAEVVEANNKIRTLEAEEQRVIIVILQTLTDFIRPQVPALLESYKFLGKIDLIRAKSIMADHMNAIEPHVEEQPVMEWYHAVHPLLETSLRKRGKDMNPLDITLNNPNRILLISGPNAGGKSVCLSTAGLLQYMVQCGLSVPLAEHSRVGIFSDLFIDIGDEQSIEDELSTYSGHLYNMKTMMKQCNSRSLILIDEMGSGTEPQIGAAIAKAMLHRFLDSGTYGIITTHYQNLKYFAQEHDGIVNGAMLYDRALMQPLFCLQIGMPGSSFAIEIARKIGLPEEVIAEASKEVGTDYTQSDKYLQDIVRDKRYWENKRTNIHQKEKRLDDLIEKYQTDLDELSHKRKAVITDAKEKAESLLKESNAKIENTIRAIREAQAQKEETLKARQTLNEFKQDVATPSEDKEDLITRKAEQIKQRRIRHEQRKQEQADKLVLKKTDLASPAPTETAKQTSQLQEHQYVRIQGQSTIGRIEKIKGNSAVVAAGSLRITIKTDRLCIAEAPAEEEKNTVSFLSRSTRDEIYEKKLAFKPEIDVRGMNGTEALNAVTYFVEDAILLGSTPLRILHGTGTGYLRQIIRQYLHTVPNIANCQDEHVQLGGAGITIVELKY